MKFLFFRDFILVGFSGLSQNFTKFRPLGFYTRRGCDRAKMRMYSVNSIRGPQTKALSLIEASLDQGPWFFVGKWKVRIWMLCSPYGGQEPSGE